MENPTNPSDLLFMLGVVMAVIGLAVWFWLKEEGASGKAQGRFLKLGVGLLVVLLAATYNSFAKTGALRPLKERAWAAIYKAPPACQGTITDRELKGTCRRNMTRQREIFELMWKSGEVKEVLEQRGITLKYPGYGDIVPPLLLFSLSAGAAGWFFKPKRTKWGRAPTYQQRVEPRKTPDPVEQKSGTNSQAQVPVPEEELKFFMQGTAPAAAPATKKSRRGKYRDKFLLFNDTEATLYHELVAALPQLVVFSQVSVSQMLHIRGWDANAQLNEIGRKSVDFLVCRKEGDNFAIVAAIELNGAVHELEERKRADEVKRAALEEAGIPLIVYETSDMPYIKTIRHDVARAMVARKRYEQERNARLGRA